MPDDGSESTTGGRDLLDSVSGPLLALDTADREAWIGLGGCDADGSDIRPVKGAGRHARLLLPAIDALLADHKLDARSLAGVVVNLGPGSFTGLRVGVAVAQTLGWARGVSLVGVSLFEALAVQTAPQNDRSRVFVANAEREQAFVARIAAGKSTLVDRGIVDVAELHSVDPAACYFGQLPPRVVCPVELISLEPPGRVEATLTIGRVRLRSGDTTAPASLLPIYGRASAAEELRATGRRPNYEQQRAAVADQG